MLASLVKLDFLVTFFILLTESVHGRGRVLVGEGVLSTPAEHLKTTDTLTQELQEHPVMIIN